MFVTSFDLFDAKNAPRLDDTLAEAVAEARFGNLTCLFGSCNFVTVNKTEIAAVTGFVLVASMLAYTIIYNTDLSTAYNSLSRVQDNLSIDNLLLAANDKDYDISDEDEEDDNGSKKSKKRRRKGGKSKRKNGKGKKNKDDCDCEAYCTNKYYYGYNDPVSDSSTNSESYWDTSNYYKKKRYRYH